MVTKKKRAKKRPVKKKKINKQLLTITQAADIISCGGEYEYGMDNTSDILNNNQILSHGWNVNIGKFLTTGRYNIVLGRSKYPVLYEGDYEDYCLVIKNNVALWHTAKDGFNISDTEVSPPFVVLPKVSRRLKSKYLKNMAIMNADDGDNTINVIGYYQHDNHLPQISFECLANFFNEDITLVTEMLGDGRLKLVDFIKEHRIRFTKKERQLISEDKQDELSSPKPGYNFIARAWHRPSSVLLRDVRSNGKSYLFGQDGNTYFGCELPGHPRNVESAFLHLMPKEARKAKGVLRHGEWFAIPINDIDVPREYECIATFEDGVSLPVDDDESAKHRVSPTCTIEYGSSGRILKDGTFYVLGLKMQHSRRDHPDINIKTNQWYMIKKNTALRSFSQEGVD